MMRKAETGATVRVIELPADRLAEATGVLARGYQDHPNFVDFYPDEKVRARALPLVCTAGFRDALGFGHVYAAMRGGGVVGVTCWLPPGAFPLSLRRQLQGLPDVVRILATAPRSAPRHFRFMNSVSRRHPEQPYWYLENVGVEPAAQGMGIGTRLLEPVLTLADAAGQSCYLETQTERNVAWYRKLGFEVKEAGVRFVPAGPPNWTMIRHPVRDQTVRDRKAGGPNGEGGTT